MNRKMKAKIKGLLLLFVLHFSEIVNHLRFVYCLCVGFHPGEPDFKSDASFLIPKSPGLPPPSTSGRARGRAQESKAAGEGSVCGEATLSAVLILSQEERCDPSDIGGNV